MNRAMLIFAVVLMIFTFVGCTDRSVGLSEAAEFSSAINDSERNKLEDQSITDDDGTIEQEAVANDGVGYLITDDELNEIFGNIPKKYQNHDRYAVAHPKNDVITTYIWSDGDYMTIETPVPDAMITFYEFISPISNVYAMPEIARIVFDEEKDMLCVNFAAAPEETDKTAIMNSISKSIMENRREGLVAVYFEVNMEPYN